MSDERISNVSVLSDMTEIINGRYFLAMMMLMILVITEITVF